jgi:NAD(P)-dependent dehydrogenase (short-subunit alcohol dehydrogenase family)
MPLQGKSVLIIGGSAGIGRATAAMALANGASVTIASRSEEHLAEAKKLLGSVKTCVMDVRDARAMEYCFESLEPLDHLVFTAAEIAASPFLQTEIESARKLFDVKFWGQFAAAQSAAVRIAKGGSITLSSGVAARMPSKGLSVVGAINGAIESLTRALALELSPTRVNAISPGFIDTKGIDNERKAQIEASLPARRIGHPEDVARAILYLMENPYTTGTVLTVDGGRSLF